MGCTAGKYSDEYSPSTTAIACKDCASGKYSSELGFILCKLCAFGKYNHEIGKFGSGCTRKYNRVAGSSAETACKYCAWKYSDQPGGARAVLCIWKVQQ